MKLHAETMKKWRETVRDLRQQDDKCWETMKARSSLAPLTQRHRTATPSHALAQPKVTPTGPRPAKGHVNR